MMFLISLGLKNDKESEFIANIYINYYPMMRSNIIKILKNNDTEIEDIIHNVCVKLIDHIDILSSFNQHVLTAYICYTCKNAAINFIKRRDIKSNLLFYGDEDDIAESYIDDKKTPEDIMIIKEDFARLRIVLDKMSEKYRLILYYKYFFDMDDKDIAAIFDTKPDNVRKYASKARKKAYKIFKKEESNETK